MLQANNLSKTYGDNVILEGVTLIVNRGERLGLVGPNGCGKTTLLKIVVGQEAPDRGSVSFTPPDLRIGYLEQALSYPKDATVAEVMQQTSDIPVFVWMDDWQKESVPAYRLGGPGDPCTIAANAVSLGETVGRLRELWTWCFPKKQENATDG